MANTLKSCIGWLVKFLAWKREGMQTVAFTGRIEGVTRKRAEILARNLGWCVSKKITHNTTAVIVGTMDNSRLQGDDSEKLKKAKSQGMRMISAAEFLEMIG